MTNENDRHSLDTDRPCGLSRRAFVHAGAMAVAGSVVIPRRSHAAEEIRVEIDPSPVHDLSPFLSMQFMEPLGTNDSSVEASWDHLGEQWKPELIEQTRSLAPGMMRWGGLLAAYYKWREGVGPRNERIPMHNLVWGGIESNQVGTAEFVDFCRQVGSEPLMCVNFESEGRPGFRKAKDSDRVGTAQEAADWVAYCNHPQHSLRVAHGHRRPHAIRHWQIGNETSYAREGFDLETAAVKTVEFAKAMRGADPSIQLIGWADSGWASRMSEVAGEHLQYLAFHHMFDPDDPKSPVLRGERYRSDPLATWQILMQAWKHNDRKIRSIREDAGSSKIPLAMTECHFAIPGNNRNDVLRTWAAGVSYARILNNHQRHGDVLKIATAADFCGTRWTVNAVMLGTHPDRVYLMPVAKIMRQYQQYLGDHALHLRGLPDDVDAVASRTGDDVYVNFVNTSFDRVHRFAISVDKHHVASAQGVRLVESPMVEISSLNCREVMQPVEFSLARDEAIELPAASVTSIKIKIESA